MSSFIGGWAGKQAPFLGAFLGAVLVSGSNIVITANVFTGTVSFYTIDSPSTALPRTDEDIYIDQAQIAFQPLGQDGQLVICLSEHYTANASPTVRYRVRFKRSFDYGEEHEDSWADTESVVDNASHGAIAVDVQSGVEFASYYDRTSPGIKVNRRNFGEDWQGPWSVTSLPSASSFVMELSFDIGRRLVIVYEVSGVIWRKESRNGGETWSLPQRVTPGTAPQSTYPSLVLLPEDYVEFVAVWEDTNSRWALYRSKLSSMRSNCDPQFERVSYIVTDSASESGALEWADGDNKRLTFITWNPILSRLDRWSSFDAGENWVKEMFKEVE